MSRTSISFTQPNDEWIKSQIDSKEFSSKSDVINNLVRKARSQQAEIEYIRAKLIKSEQSGFTKLGREEMLAEIKKKARQDGII